LFLNSEDNKTPMQIVKSKSVITKEIFVGETKPTGYVIEVHDGDTFTVRGNIRIRLEGVNAAVWEIHTAEWRLTS